jgi:hypothetical protein
MTKERSAAKRECAKKSTTIMFHFTGDIRSFDKEVIEDADLRSVFHWMAKRGTSGFTESELAHQLAEYYEDGAGLARDTLNFLRELDALATCAPKRPSKKSRRNGATKE